MKYSRQREMILETVKGCYDHPTADTIYTRVRALDEHISLGTVYRNLNLLCKTGQLRKVSISGGGDRFDATLEPHGHIVCTDCGALCDVAPDCMESLAEQVSRCCSYHVTRCELILEGLCPACRAKKSS